MSNRPNARSERGTILLVVVFIAIAIAGLAAISSGRVVYETRHHKVMEDDVQALNAAYARIHIAMNVVNNSAYDDQNHNLEIRNALDAATSTTTQPNGNGNQKATGGRTQTATNTAGSWLDDPEGVTHGIIGGTDVRVYRARDYIKRLQKLKGEAIEDVDPFGDSDAYFVLEGLGSSGDSVRLVSALVRETEPFSSFVFFQDQHLLGISGAPRGLIHSNADLAFYFPNGRYLDSVSSVGGFEYKGGATPENTTLRSGNPSAAPIELKAVDFNELKGKSIWVGEPGLDAEIKLFRMGKARITPYTPPRVDQVTQTFTQKVIVGYEEQTYTTTQQVQVGTTTETRTRTVITGYTTETYTVDVPVYENQQVEKTRQVPVYEAQTVTKTRWVKVFVPYDTGGDVGGGTTIGDSGAGVLGEYQWVQEQYQTTEMVIVDYQTEYYTVTEPVQVGTTTETRTRQVPVYGTETYTVDVPVYEAQEVVVTETVPIYDTVTQTKTTEQYQPPVALGFEHVWLTDDIAATVYVDGRITSLEGELNGRLTVVGTEKVRITGDIQYIDDGGQTAMLNGSNYSLPYQRNPDYTGDSVLGVIAQDDIVFTWNMPNNAEINATLMSVGGRVGADALWLDSTGEVYKDSNWARRKLLSPEESLLESYYDRSGTYRTRRFAKDSLRRLGGIISSERIVETYIRARSDGTAYVDGGFRRGAMRFDFNLMHNPPPNFVEIPRPVVAAFMPVFFVRNDDA